MVSKPFATSGKSERLVLLGIVAVAVLARFWRCWALPLTYDEYSTWYRIWPTDEAVPNFFDAVALDAHPMLHHAWYRLLGECGLLMPDWEANLILKLPFLLAGVLAVYLCYVAGKRWFNAQTGLFVAGLMAVLQPAVMHAQIARPYALGLLFVVATAVSLKGILAGRRSSVVWTSLWFALAMYAHYFSGLTALGLGAIVLLTNRAYWKPLCVSAATAGLLFLPHLGITLKQLGHGDLATVVSPPDAMFVADHLAYSFNYALPWFGILAAMLLAFWRGVTPKKRSAVLAVWAIPMCVGGAYSLAVGPILQDRVLLFGLPFLVAGIVGFWRPIAGKWQALVVGIFVVGMGAVLVFGRQHYTVFYEREYVGVWEGVLESDGEEGYVYGPSGREEQPPVALLSYHQKILGASFSQFSSGPWWSLFPLVGFVPDSTTTESECRRVLAGSFTSSAYLGLTGHYDRPRPEFLSMFVQRYPSLHSTKGFHNGAWYWLTDEPTPPLLTLDADWNFESGKEWGELVKIEVELEQAGWLFMYSEVTQESGRGDMRLVCEFKQDGEVVHYKALEAGLFRLPFETRWRVHLGFFLEDMRAYPNADVEVYWWNPSGIPFTAGPLQVRTLPRNPYQYGLTESLRR